MSSFLSDCSNIVMLSGNETASRYPQPVSPWLNLVMLMTPTSWAWTLTSLATVALCFNVASLVVRRWMGMRLENIAIDLWPLR